MLRDGWKLWLEWNELCAQFGQQNPAHFVRREAEMLRVDDGRTFGFTRLIAKRPVCNPQPTNSERSTIDTGQVG
jgi:hypothetical protein